MEDKELLKIWDLIKDDINITKKINLSKLLRQLEIFICFKKNKGKGYVEACTRFGKTMVAIIAIKKMNLVKDTNKTIVVVPKINLADDWLGEKGHINVFNLKNVEVYVVNSFVLADNQWNCDFLVLDEIHRYANEDSEFFSKILFKTNYRYVLGLSATIDSTKKEFLSKYGLKRVGHVTLDEAERKNWVAKHYIYNVGLDFETEEAKEEYKRLDEIYHGNFSKFSHNYQMARACSLGEYSFDKRTNSKVEQRFYIKQKDRSQTIKEWKLEIATNNGWSLDMGSDHQWSPKSISEYAQQWSWATKQRQSILYNEAAKLTATKAIVERLQKPTLIFSESVLFADGIASLLEEKASSYHSKILTKIYKDESMKEVIAFADSERKYRMVRSGELLSLKEIRKIFKNCKRIGGNNLKRKIKEDFNSGVIDYLSTVKAIDEGFDSDRAQVGIIASGTSTELQDIQRKGRSLNQVDGKVATIINLYIKETQDLKWLKKRQINTPEGKIKWIEDIELIEIT